MPWRLQRNGDGPYCVAPSLAKDTVGQDQTSHLGGWTHTLAQGGEGTGGGFLSHRLPPSVCLLQP